MSRSNPNCRDFPSSGESGLAFFSSESTVGNGFEVTLKTIGPHKLDFVHVSLPIHSLMVYLGLIEHNIVGNTKVQLMSNCPFISKLRAGYTMTIGQYMNYQTFSGVQFTTAQTFFSLHAFWVERRERCSNTRSVC